jgi:5-methylthioadenosine/S-adenosylhomocysteine deaminase
MPMRIWIRNARVLTMDDRDSELEDADILVEDQIIASVGRALPVSGTVDRVIDAAGMLVMPGLVNAHFHSPGTLMRGSLDGMPLEIFMLYEVPPLADALPVERVMFLNAQLAAIEMLKCGTTAVHDDAFHVPLATVATVDALMQAYAEIGIRATVAIDQPNVVEYEKYPFLYDLLPPAIRERMARAPRQSADELVALYRHLIERWHGFDGGRLRAAVSCSAPQRVTPEYLARLSALSRSHDLPFNIHILETKLQRVLGAETLGKSLVRYVADLGLLDERMMVIHAIWIDDEDIALLARAGVTVAHNPICNMRLGSGIMPFRRLRRAGVALCLGTDEAAVDDAVNIWAVAKMAALLHTLTDADYDSWPKPPEILSALIRGGARAMRLAGEIGVVAPGRQADLIVVDLGTLAFTPLNDLRRQLVFCENGSSVRLTMVAGRVVAENGRVLTVDEEAIKAEIRALSPACRGAFARTQAAARELEPFYRAMYEKATSRDVGLDRWASRAE